MNPPPPLRLGTWLSIGDPAIAELASLCGFDWALLDLEHGCAPESALPGQLRALAAGATEGIVRVGAPHPDQIARVLDWGAHGIMVPRVESAAAAEGIVAAACHSPQGQRGFSRTVRATGYGLREHPPKPCLMAQIETLAGVAAAGEIAAVEGIDVLFVGPADLRHDLQHRRDGADQPDYEGCLSTVAEAARAAGKETGILLRDPSALAAYEALGFTRIALDSDLSILRRAYQGLLRGREREG